MSLYRKDNSGNIKRLAGNIVQKLVERYFVCTRTIEDSIEYYDIPADFETVVGPLRDKSAYIFKMNEPNTTTNPKLRYKNIVLDIINSDSSILLENQLLSIYQYVIDLTDNKAYILSGGRVALGTVIIVDGEVESIIQFSSDPQLQLTNITNGTTIVKKAEQDELGQNIKDTYATKTYIDDFSFNGSQITDKTVALSKLADDVIEKIDSKQPVGDYATKEELESIDKQEIVYDKDSSDPEINLGYPNGILAGAEAITSIDFSKYRYVIVDCLMSTRATAICYIGKLQTAVSLSGGYIGFMTIDINTQYLKVASAKEIYLYETNQFSWYDKAGIYNISKITGVLKYENSNT